MPRCMALLLLSGMACAFAWPDPAGDASAPDLTEIQTSLSPTQLTVRLSFAGNDGLADLGGYIDFEIDGSLATGRPSHFLDFGLEPALAMGVDYFVWVVGVLQEFELWQVSPTGNEILVGTFPYTTNDSEIILQIPRYSPLTPYGMNMGAIFEMSVIVGSDSCGCFTDWAPDSGTPLISQPEPGDLDQDGDIDQADALALRGCLTGSGQLIPTGSNCGVADLDEDGDVDLDDFALLQRNLTGPAAH